MSKVIAAQQILEQMVIFTLSGCRIVQGNKTISLEALKLTGEKPPVSVYNDGGLKTVSKHLVNPFDSIKKRADRDLQGIAVSFLNGYGTSEEKSDGVGSKLDSYQSEFEGKKVELRPKFNQLQEEHYKQYPGWEDTLRGLAPSADAFFNGMRFRWDAFKVGATKNAGLQKGIQAAAGSLFATMCSEVAATAHEIHSSLLGKDKLKAGNTIVARLATIAQKLDGISFIDPRVGHLAQLVKDAIAGMSLKDALGNQQIFHLMGLASILKDEANLVMYGDGLLDGSMSNGSIIGSFAKPSVPAPVAPIQGVIVTGVQQPVVAAQAVAVPATQCVSMFF